MLFKGTIFKGNTILNSTIFKSNGILQIAANTRNFYAYQFLNQNDSDIDTLKKSKLTISNDGDPSITNDDDSNKTLWELKLKDTNKTLADIIIIKNKNI